MPKLSVFFQLDESSAYSFPIGVKFQGIHRGRFFLNQIVAECDAVSNEQRRECGFHGITPKHCESRGCCWGAIADKNKPWCFYPKSKFHASVSLLSYLPNFGISN